MQRPRTSARPAAPGLTLLVILPLFLAAATDPVEDARARLERNDARGAVAILEAGLTSADPSDRPALVEGLLKAYAAAARQAEAEGRPDEAEEYRENLGILERKPRPAATNAPAATTPPIAPANDPEPPREAPPTPPTPADPADELPPPLKAATEANVPAQAPASPAEPVVTPLPAAPPPSPEEERVREADTAFLAGRYKEAGQVYAALAQAGKLPAERRPHWAYCRAVGVVERINARPGTAKGWATIDAEIRAIQALSPSNWFAEYLRRLAAERRKAKAGRVVVRGSSPDEPPPTKRPSRKRPPAAPPSSPDPAPAPTPPLAAGPVSSVPWSPQRIETANFAVAYVEKDRALAESVARAAESAREGQVKRWKAAKPDEPWSPRCEIILFPTAKDFTRETLQPDESPGFSTMGMNAGKIVLRRIHLRTDHPNLVKAILPHEVTHVVIADLFPRKQIPRWADEGLAVLAEPRSEQALRVLDLDDPLKNGRVFNLNDLMAMDYPEAPYWGLYYAQSVSLTRFLVESGTPEQFLTFVQACQDQGAEPALAKVYGIEGFAPLQARWLAFARERSAEMVAAGNAPADRPTGAAETTRR